MIRGTKRVINTPDYSVNTNMSIHNRFDIDVVDVVTGEVRQKAYAENIVLNQLWAYMLNNSSGMRKWNQYIQFGTGTGTPVATRTSLFTYLGGKISADAGATDIDKVFTHTRKISISETENVGAILTEVGISQSASSASLVTHAMLKDMNGNQISITKTSTDIINIYATVFFHYAGMSPVNLASGQSQLKLWGIGLMDANLFSGTILGGPLQESLANVNTFTFDSNNKKLTVKMDRAGATLANNSNGINQLLMSNVFNLDVTENWFSGSTVTGEAIGTGDGVTTAFSTRWGAVKAGTSKIYVNGVEDVTATIIPDIPTGTLILDTYRQRYFKEVDAQGNILRMAEPTVPQNGTVYWYNPYYANYGILSIRGASSGFTFDIYASDDLSAWTKVGTCANTGIATIAEAYRKSKYFKLQWVYGNFTGSTGAIVTDTPNNIVFVTPPASGAVITADYVSKWIGKDANHVLDFTLVMNFGEKTT